MDSAEKREAFERLIAGAEEADPFEEGTLTITMRGGVFLRFTQPEDRLRIMRCADRIELDGDVLKERRTLEAQTNAELDELRDSLAKRLAEVNAVRFARGPGW
jgi:hypothetical protein